MQTIAVDGRQAVPHREVSDSLPLAEEDRLQQDEDTICAPPRHRHERLLDLGGITGPHRLRALPKPFLRESS
jgi:hypothetical protein